MRTRSRWSPLLTAAAAVLLTGAYGCGPRERDASETTAGDAALRLSDVTLGKSVGADNRVTNRTTEFGTRDTIYAVVETDRSAAGGTVTARWTFQDGQVVDESNRTIAANGANITTFHIRNPAGWPTGRYRVEILTNGTVARTEEFTVR